MIEFDLLKVSSTVKISTLTKVGNVNETNVSEQEKKEKNILSFLNENVKDINLTELRKVLIETHRIFE